MGSGKGAVDVGLAAQEFAAEADLAIGEGGIRDFEREYWR